MRMNAIIILISFLQGSYGGYDCVERCLCKAYEGMSMADCSHTNKTYVPQPTGQFKVDILHLEGNQISTISRRDFTNYKHLYELNLMQNALKTFGNSSFSEMINLRKLDLSHNIIQTITNDMIDHLKHSLRWLSVANNLLHDIPEGLAEFDILDYLDVSRNNRITSLRTDQLPPKLVELNVGGTGLIHLDGNALGMQQRIETIHLENMNSLEIVDLSDHRSISIHQETFKSLPSLRRLILRNCNIEKFPAFSNSSITADVAGMTIGIPLETCNTSSALSTLQWYNPKLQEIDFSDNSKLSILPGEATFPPSLLQLKLSNTSIPMIEHSFMQYAPRVQILDLHHANIQHIDRGILVCLSNLKEVLLSENQLNAVPDLPHTVEMLSFSRMKIEYVNHTMFKDLNRVISLDLSDNEIRIIEDMSFANMTALQRLNLSGNAVTSLSKNMLPIGVRNASSSLQIVDLSRGTLREIESSSFSSHRQLETLLLNDNALVTVGSNTLEVLINLQTLDLSRNDILDITDGAFSTNAKLQVLHLEHNRIHTILPGAFRGLVGLRELYLQFNELTKALSSPLPELRILDMSSNRLRSLPEFDGNNLTLLNVSMNPLTKLEGKYFLTRNRLQSVNLSFCNLDEIPYSNMFNRVNLLQTLDLTGNRIKSLPNVTLPILTDLYIGGNKIREISEKHVRYIGNLTYLDMRKTNFTSIDVKIFKTLHHLETFSIDGSYLPCTCDLREFGIWASIHEDIVVGEMACYWPPESVEKCAVSTINALDCQGSTHDKTFSESSVYIAVSVAVTLLLVLVVFLVRAWRKRTSPIEFEMQQTGDFERLDYYDQCCKCMSPLKCCLQARESVYSRSRMRLFSNDESEFAVSPLDKNAPST